MTFSRLYRRAGSAVTFEVLESDRLGHRICFLAFRHVVFVKPDIFCRLALFKKQQIGANRRIGFEHGIRQPDDGVEIALLHQMFLQPCLHALTEQ